MTQPTSTFWARKEWNYDEWTDDLGVWVVGTAVEKRFHTTTIKDAVNRYEAVVVSVKYAGKRMFNDYGNEIAPVFKNLEASKNPRLSMQELAEALRIPEGMMPKPDMVHPTTEDQFEFWCQPKDGKLFDQGDEVIIRTAGGWFPQVISRNDGTFGSSLSKDDALMGAVGGLMDRVQENHDDQLAHEQNEGVDSDEWDDY